MSAGFDHRQLKKLATPLDRARVQTREQEGKTLSYIEGWFAIAEANRIFGYDGWDREMVHFERVFERNRSDGATCAYMARVQIRVRAHDTTIVREGSGFGHASAPTLGDAHERALKAAETDATKRALSTFGGRFGLMLYEKPASAPNRSVASGQINDNSNNGRADDANAVMSDKMPAPKVPNVNGTGPIYRLAGSDGASCDVHSAESFCSGLRQLVEAAREREEIDRLRVNNSDVLVALKALPALTTARGEHYADILNRLMARRRGELPEPVADPPAKVASAEEQATEAARALRPEQELQEPVRTYKAYVPVPPFPLAKIIQCFTAKDREVTEGTRTVQGIAHQDVRLDEEDRIAEATPVATVPILAAAPTRRSQISGGLSIDKSVFAIPSERRLRSKAHLIFVASKPCLVCEGLPCHAHYVTFAQPRGLSLKVSDEYTVPLCVVHHNELHASGNEASWWRAQGIEPLVQAQELWRASMGVPEEAASPIAATEIGDTAPPSAPRDVV